MRLIEREREGELVDRALIKNILGIFIEVGEVKNILGMLIEVGWVGLGGLGGPGGPHSFYCAGCLHSLACLSLPCSAHSSRAKLSHRAPHVARILRRAEPAPWLRAFCGAG